ncbi:FtsK/SpoIIIE domain-containing protein [Cellulosimicrobium composti]|uniref:FtsK/SpoIIIE domain-containing protein n=1 Tax=Cellulosimicrobium composti TaxID=2672572 RepID=UPI003796F5A4
MPLVLPPAASAHPAGPPPSVTPVAAPGALRVTVHPGTDVLLDAGARLGDARAALARLACRPELRTAPLVVDGVAVDDDQRCGTRPLLPGATLAVRGGPSTAREPSGARRGSSGAEPGGAGAHGADDPARADEVLAAPLHLAVVGGADAGRVVALTSARGRVVLDGLDVRWRARRRGTRVRVRAPRGTRRVPDDAGTLLARSVRAGRVVPRWRTTAWRPGHALAAPRGVYALRPRPGLAHGPRTGPALPTTGGTSPGRPGAAHLTTALAPVAASLALAAAFRQPLYALLALVGPLALVVPALVEARRRRAAARQGALVVAEPGGGARPGVADAPVAAHLDPLLPRPADVLTWAAVARLAPAVGGALGPRRDLGRSTGRAPGGSAGGPSGVGAVGPVAGDPAGGDAPAGPVPPRLPDGCLAVVGPRPRALGAARAVLAEHLAAGAALTVRHPPPAAADWAWCRWLPGASAVADLADVVPGSPATAVARAASAVASPAPSDAPRVPVADGTAPSRAPGVLVVDGHAPPGELATAWERLRAAGTDVLLVVEDAAHVPAWCRTVLDVTGAAAVLVGPDGARTEREHVAAGTAWAEALARRLAAAARLGRLGGTPSGGADPADPTAPSLPPDVALGHLLGAPRARHDLAGWVGARWDDAPRRDRRGLRTVLGVDADGQAVTVDLVEDGPHVLVAGTTGAGKSELLQTLVLGLALGRSPDEVTFALVDFKGGTSFGACGRLPHVVGQVTDLDPGLARRALDGLRAELHRRERVLTAAGATSVDDLPRGRLPRLVVVVDEFRALADDLPELLPGLLRVAAQGRALGVHLVLATQRPAGAVSADVRANITLRLALRVVDVADSRDVVECPHAALVPAWAPGRLVLRRGAEPPLAVQCARASGETPAAAPGARLAPPWHVPRSATPSLSGGGPTGRRAVPSGDLTVGDRSAGPPSGDATAGDATAGDALARLVDAAREVAARRGARTPPPPWLPPLPTHVGADELERAEVGPSGSAVGQDGADRSGASDPAGLPLALGDVPAQQRRAVLRWDPTDGHLAVLGRARSGRTSALRTAAWAALERGWAVHAVGAFADLSSHPGTGTVVGRGDVRRLVRLLRLLAGHDDAQGRPPGLVGHDDAQGRPPGLAGPDRGQPPGATAHHDGQSSGPAGTGARRLLVVDDVEAVRAALADVAGGAGADLLADVLAEGTTAVALAGSGPTVGGLAAHVGVRVVLASRDRHDDVSLGVPSALAGQGGPAGRAVWLGPDDPLLCQVALPRAAEPGPETDPPVRPTPDAEADARPGGRAHLRAQVRESGEEPGTVRVTGGWPGVMRLARLPDRVDASDLDRSDPYLHLDPARPPQPGSSVGPGPGAGPPDDRRAGPASAEGLRVLVGRGGDDARTLSLDVSRGALVVGPPGSGRTSALRLVVQQVARVGALRGVVARDGAVAALAPRGTPTARRFTPSEVAALLDAVAASGPPVHPPRRPSGDPTHAPSGGGDPTHGPTGGGAAPGVVAVDDLDVLAQLCVLEADRLATLARDGIVLVATATTASAATALRGPLADLRGARTGVVLAPGERGSSEVFGHSLAWLAEPGRPRPGRGVLVDGARLAPVQVAVP